MVQYPYIPCIIYVILIYIYIIFPVYNSVFIIVCSQFYVNNSVFIIYSLYISPIFPSKSTFPPSSLRPHSSQSFQGDSLRSCLRASHVGNVSNHPTRTEAGKKQRWKPGKLKNMSGFEHKFEIMYSNVYIYIYTQIP